MKKIITAVVFVLIFTCGYAAENHMTPVSGERSDVSRLIGKTVKNFQGDDLGRISEFVKGPKGHIAFVMLNYRVTNNTQKRIALPIGVLSCGNEYCVLNASRETVGTTPPFVSKQDLAQTRTAANIYLYFGIQPYWTGGETSGEK